MELCNMTQLFYYSSDSDLPDTHDKLRIDWKFKTLFYFVQYHIFLSVM